MSKPASYTCPFCGATSHHPRDVEERYCGRCHRWGDDYREPDRSALQAAYQDANVRVALAEEGPDRDMAMVDASDAWDTWMRSVLASAGALPRQRAA